MKKFLLITIAFLFCLCSKSQNVGIGTLTPNANARLHVDLQTSTSSGVLFSGTFNGAATVPDLGAGTRMMFFPGKSAFRAGTVGGTQWDNANVGSYSIAMGNGTIANANFSMALGNGTMANKLYSTAIGYNALADGSFSMAFGNTTTTLGASSTAMGSNTIAGGSNSTAMGYYNIARGFASTVTGMYNDTILTANEIVVTPSSPLFIVGNGDNNSTRKNAMVVRKDGKVGIGTSIPDSSALLDVASTTQGMLTPRMTTAQRTAILNPANGLLVFDNETKSFWYHDGSAWGELSAINNNLWNKSVNNIYNTNTANTGIGTTSPTAKLHVDLALSNVNGVLFTGSANALGSVPDLGAGTRMMFYPAKTAFRAGHVTGNHWNNVYVGRYSTATGYNPVASGDYSTASGYTTTAGGEYSFATGYGSIASGPSAFAAGESTQAINMQATALGNLTIASGAYSLAGGIYSEAKGLASVAFGNSSLATGSSATAIGNDTEAKGEASLASGINSDAKGAYSFAAGNHNITKGYSSTVIGMFNDSLLFTDQTVSTSTTPLFIIGNGSSNINRSNAMMVRKDGRIGIGTDTPLAVLHMDLGTSTTNGFLITGTANGGGQVPSLGAGSRMMFYPSKDAFRAGGIDGTQWDNANVGRYSAAFGVNTTASSFYCFAAGNTTIADGGGAAAFGSHTKALGGASFASGSSTTASGLYSSAFGFLTIAKGYSTMVLGMYNDSLLTIDELSPSATTPLLIVGNGNDVFTRSNALVVRKNGDTEVQNLKVGGGTLVSKHLAGEIIVGSNPGTGFKTYTYVFPSAFSGTPKLTATAKNDPGFSNVDDSFTISIRSISATQVIFNIQRVDSNTGWSQQLRVEWMAWE